MAEMTGGRIIWSLETVSHDFEQGLASAKAQAAGLGVDFAKVGQSMSDIGRNLTKFVTLPVLGVGAAIAKTSVDFQTSMQEIVALVGVSQAQVDAWGKEIIKLGPELGKSPKELADALYFVTSAGIDAKDAMSVLTASAKAASAGLGETGVIADAVTSAVNAYGIANLSASKATDVLVAAVKLGKVEANELAPVLGRIIPTAAALKISFSDVAGVMAVMSRTGLDAAEAATSVSAIMSTMLKPSAEARDLLAGVGLSMKELRDTAAKPGGLVEVMRILDEKFGDNDEALATIIPNIRAFRGVMNVLAQDGATVDDVLKQVANSTGETDRAFQAMQKTAGFKFHAAMASIQGLLIDLGDNVMPALANALDGISRKLKAATEWWNRQSDSTQNNIIKFSALAAAVGPVLFVMGKLLTTFGPMVGAATGLAAAVLFLELRFHAFSNLPTALKQTITALTVAFVTLRVALSIWDAVDRMRVAFEAFRLITLPGTIASLSTLATTLSGPLGLAIVGVSLAVGVLVGWLFKKKQATDNATASAYGLNASQNILGGTMDRVAAATSRLKAAKDALKQTNLDLEGATLRVERAQRTYEQAVKDFGPNSLEAREALHDLHQAEVDLKNAHANAEQKAKDQQAAITNLAKEMEAKKKSIQDFTDRINQIPYSHPVSIPITISSSPISLSPQELQQIIPGATFRAVGGDVFKNSPYVVGEKGPELFVPKENGTIVPNNIVSGASTGHSAGAGGTVNHIGTIIINDEVDGRYWLDKLTHDQEVVSRGLTPQRVP